jgi:hypothetical protein
MSYQIILKYYNFIAIHQLNKESSVIDKKKYSGYVKIKLISTIIIYSNLITLKKIDS